MATSDMTLPLMCKAIHLAKVPGLPLDKRYAVIWGGGIRQPSEGMGYIFELTGKRTGKPVAWIRDGGYVYATDELMVRMPASLPVIELALWRNRPGTGTVKRRIAHDGATGQAAEFRVSDMGYQFQDPVCDLGSVYSVATCRLVEFLAVAFLAFWYVPRQSESALAHVQTMGSILESLLDFEVADAVDIVIAEVASGERTSGFERYAARILSDLDPQALRKITTHHRVGWRRLKTTGLIWFLYDPDQFDSAEIDLLIAYEGAFNRLALMAYRAHEAGSDALTQASEVYCADEDWHTLRTITQQSATLLGGSQTSNKLIVFGDYRAQAGGEWDIRTRLTQALEHLMLPYRLVYRFACNAEQGLIKLIVSVPQASAMPHWRRGASRLPSGLDDVRENIYPAASAYSIRLMAALAEASFGAGTGVKRVRIVLCRDIDLSVPLVDARFERISFLSGMREHINADDFSDPILVTDAERLLEFLKPNEFHGKLDHIGAFMPLSTLDDDAIDVVEVVSDPDRNRKVPLLEDERFLPHELAARLHAYKVSDLDIFHVGQDPFADRVREAASLSHSDPNTAAQQLSDLIDMMDLMAELNGDPVIESENAEPAGKLGQESATLIKVKPLYCSNNMARLAMAFEEQDPEVRYTYVLDSVYDARVMLSRLCTEHNDAEHGLEYAREAIELGPTSSQAYIAAATAYVSMHKFNEAVKLLRQALRYEMSPATASYLYYRIAFALWQGGDARAGLACYMRALPNPRIMSAAAEEMRALMEQNHIEHEFSPEETSAELARAQVPEGPSENLVDLAHMVMVCACDAGFLNVAQMYKQSLVGLTYDDATVAALASFAPWNAQANESHGI